MPRGNHAVRLGNSASVFRPSRLTSETHGVVLQSPSFVHARPCGHFTTRACADAHEGDPANNETHVTTAQRIPPVCEGLPADNEAWHSEREGAAVVRGVSRFENEARTRGRKAPRGTRSTGLRKTKRARCATRSPLEQGRLGGRLRDLGGRGEDFTFGESCVWFRDEGFGGRRACLRRGHGRHGSEAEALALGFSPRARATRHRRLAAARRLLKEELADAPRGTAAPLSQAFERTG